MSYIFLHILTYFQSIQCPQLKIPFAPHPQRVVMGSSFIQQGMVVVILFAMLKNSISLLNNVNLLLFCSISNK
jgi:hypothetical protein